MKFTVRGVVKEVAFRRRLLFFRDAYLMVTMNPDDITRLEREVNAHFPGYGSLGHRGCAINLTERGIDPSQFPAGTTVEMTATVSNQVESYFFGAPPLGLDSVRPLTANS